METWQKLVIQKNLPQLIELTECSPKFLSILQCNSILGLADLDQLMTSLNSKGRLTQTCELYNMLISRTKSYECLIKAAFECGLTGVLKILLTAYDSHSKSCGFLGACGIALNLTDILKKQVVYQGSKLTFEDCFKLVKKDKLQELLRNTLTGLEFLKLHNSDIGDKLVLVKNTVPETVPYYIERSLLIQNRIDPGIFQNEMELDDIFVFKNIEWNQLSLLVAPNRTQRSTNQLQRLTVRFILLERNEDFDTICQLRELKSVYWIDHKDEKYYLLRTEGNIRKIEKYILPEESVITEADIVQGCVDGDCKVVCLSDTPGMGKSILLGNIAKRLPFGVNTLTIFIVLSEVSKILQDLKVISEIDVLDILQKVVSDNELGRKLVEIMLNSESSKVNLFFDGFDEILPTQLKHVKTFLKMCSQFRNAILFVTTRPHMRRELENLFGVQSLRIRPFTLIDQTNFLQTYWCNKNNTASCSKLKDLARNCLSNLQRNMKNTEKDIAGIPLQCVLLAEVYLKEAKLCCDATHDFHFHILPETNSVIGMYKNLVRKRFDERGGTDSYETLTYLHARYALDLIFPYWSENLTALFATIYPNNNIDNHNQTIKLYNIGILEAETGLAPRFVHRTLAEYFIAIFIKKVLKNHISVDKRSLNQFNRFLWRTVFTPQYDEKANTYIFQNSAICYFLNEELTVSKFLKSSEIIHYSRATNDMITKENWFQVLLCSVSHDLGNIFQITKLFFIETDENCSEACTTVSRYGNLLLLRGAQYASADLFQQCYNLTRTMKGFVESIKTRFSNTPLSVAVKRGSYPIVEYLLSTYHDTESLYGQCLLHHCVMDSSKEEIGVVNEKVEIVKLLVNKQFRLLNEKNSFGYTALLRPNIHINLIKCLIEKGADLRGGGEVGSSIAHRAAMYMSPQEFHCLVRYLVEINCGALMNIRGPSGRTPLHEALVCLDLDEKTVELISTVPGIDFNEKDGRGNSILYSAVGSGRNLAVLSAIIKHGGNWKARNYLRSKMIHAAAKVGNVDAIRLFISLGGKVNAKNKNRRTPLHFALRCGKVCVHEMVSILIENGANVNSVDVFGQSPLWIALNSRNSKFIESRTIALLREAGAKEFPSRYYNFITCIANNGT